MPSIEKVCGSGSTLDVGLGGNAWTNTNKLTACDSDYAYCIQSDADYSYSIIGSNFGFSIPETAVITGIEIKITVTLSPDLVEYSNVFTGIVALYNNNAVIFGSGLYPEAIDNYWIDYTQEPGPFDPLTFTYGGDGYMWGQTGFSPTMINGSGFGGMIVPYFNVTEPMTGYTDCIKMTVYYTQKRPFAVYSGATPDGTTKIYNLLTGTSIYDYSGNIGGTVWYMGPEESSGYIVAKDNVNKPRFWRSAAKTEASFIALVNSIKGAGPYYTTIGDCQSFLTSGEYYTDYPFA